MNPLLDLLNNNVVDSNLEKPRKVKVKIKWVRKNKENLFVPMLRLNKIIVLLLAGLGWLKRFIRTEAKCFFPIKFEFACLVKFGSMTLQLIHFGEMSWMD